MNKNLGLFCILTLLVIFCRNADAQIPPPGAGDKSLEDRSIKNRSVEMERIKRDANKPEPLSKEAQERQFSEIKEDFEQIQHAQSGIVDGYTKGKTIDYEKIASNADRMSSGGKRLMGNLFPPAEIKKGDKKAGKTETKTETAPPTEVKALIVDLDNSLAAFTGNPMFTNPKVVNSDDNLKAKAELEKIVSLSAALKQEAEKLKKQ